MEKELYNNPFEKSVPSVFAVSSPLQIMCAIAAIRQLEITDYIMVVRFPIRNSRNLQVKNLLNHFGIAYKSVYNLNRYTSKFYMYKCLLRKQNRYKRLFIGDFRDIFNCFIGCNYVSDESIVVYLDDGNITISQLYGRYKEFPGLSLLRNIEKRRKLVFNKNLLTLYGDIPNNYYNVCSLQLDKLITSKTYSKSQKDIYIIGTNVERYCIPLDISESSFISYLDRLMLDLREQYPNDNIIYIPHGKEVKMYAQQLCEKYSCEFRHPSIMVEMELLSCSNPPKAIYGFTSTALHTLKKIFPLAKVFNILFECGKDNPEYKEYLDISSYYQQNSIELIKVCL